MLTTAYIDGAKISIDDFRKESGKIPQCSLGHKLVAKKGKKMVHHFAHHPTDSCDPWRTGMSNWHAQWQKIVLNTANLEVCLDANGNCLGQSAFRGFGSGSSDSGHIADIIKPSLNVSTRPLVIEIQHSSMDKQTIEDREAYYKHMIWVFDLTPRIVPKGKHTKIVFVDGNVSYQKEKVSYVALLTCSGTQIMSLSGLGSIGNTAIIPMQTFDQFDSGSIANNNNSNNNNGNHDDLRSVLDEVKYTGNECMTSDLTPIQGTFIIINTRTKYWFDTKAPTYFDTGFGILRLIHKLDKGFALTLFISYEQFFKERMPPLNPKTLAKCQWFQTIVPTDLIQLSIMPGTISVPAIYVSRNRVVIKHDGPALNGLGLDRGHDDWHFGEYYTNLNQAKSSQDKECPHMSIINNTSLMHALMNQAMTGFIVAPTPPAQKTMSEEAGLIMRTRAYLGASNSLDIEIVNMKGVQTLIVYCNNETIAMKEKFKAMGMTYRRGAKKDKSPGSRKMAKQTDVAINSLIKNRVTGGNKTTLKTLNDREDRESKESRHSWHIAVSKLTSFFG